MAGALAVWGVRQEIWPSSGMGVKDRSGWQKVKKTNNIRFGPRYMKTCCVPPFRTGRNGYQGSNLALLVDIFMCIPFLSAVPLLGTI